MVAAKTEMTLDQWRGMTAEERGRWVQSMEQNNPETDVLATLAQSDGVTLEEAAEMFAWREPLLWRGSADEYQLDPAMLARVRQFAKEWLQPGTPDFVGEAVLIAGWHYSCGRDREPMSDLPDARRRDRAGCPVRAAEIAVEFVAAASAVWLQCSADDDAA